MRPLAPGQSFEGFFIQEALESEGPLLRFRVRASGGSAAALPLVLAGFRVEGGASAADERAERTARGARCASALERLRGLRHELFPAVVAAGLSDDVAWVVTEAASGMSLKRRLALTGTPVPLPEIVELGIAVAEALRAAQGAGLHHLRLSASRVLVSREARLSCLKVLDVGLVDLFGDAPDAEEDRVYRAPEQVDGGAPDERADIYALGLILYEAFTIVPLLGEPPEAKIDPFEVRTAALREELPPIDAVRPLFPEFLSALIATMVAQDPSKRPRTLADAIAGLVEMRTALPRWFVALTRLMSLGADNASVLASELVENPGSETTSGLMIARGIRAGLNGEPAPETGKPFGIEDFEVDGVVFDASGAPEEGQGSWAAPSGGALPLDLEMVEVQVEQPANADVSSPSASSSTEVEAKATPRVPYDHAPVAAAVDGAGGAGGVAGAAVGDREEAVGDREEARERPAPPLPIDRGAGERGAASNERKPRAGRASKRASWVLGAAGFLALTVSFAIVLVPYLGGAMKPWRDSARTEGPPSALPAEAARTFLAPVAIVILPSAPVAPPAPTVGAPRPVDRSDVPRAAPPSPQANSTVPEPVSPPAPAPASASASASVSPPASAPVSAPELPKIFYRRDAKPLRGAEQKP